MQDLGLDSLDHVEVIMAMEDEFGKEELSLLIWDYFLQEFLSGGIFAILYPKPL